MGGIGSHPDDVAHMKRTADRRFGAAYQWPVLGAGRSQMPIASVPAAQGGNVRVGREDSLWGGPGRLARGNADQVHRVRGIVEGLGLEIASPDEARAMLALKGRNEVGFAPTAVDAPRAPGRSLGSAGCSRAEGRSRRSSNVGP